MFRRLVRDEAGMTMGLSIIMIVLIGVMGAGLLTFVRTDLNAVVEVNRGQKAIEVSDAGVQAARRQLMGNSFPHQYNDPSAAPFPVKDGRDSNNEWAYNSSSMACGDLPAGPGKCITTDEGEVRVTIRYLPPPSSEAQRRNPNYAPELRDAGADYADKRDHFEVVTDGVFNGARRKIKAILVTEDLRLPKAYFATRSIILDGGPDINRVSLFARQNIEGVQCGTVRGEDAAYGTWQNGFNNKARLDSTRTAAIDPNAAGVAAEGEIIYTTGGPTCSGFSNNSEHRPPAASSDLYKRRDFDGLESFPGGLVSPTPDNYKFCDRNTPCWPAGTLQPANVITYPFNDGSKLNADFLKSLAEEQVDPATGNSNYVERTGGTVTVTDSTGGGSTVKFNQVTPQLSSVMVVRFTGSSPGTVNIRPTGSDAFGCPLQGTLVVVNGNMETDNGGTKCFGGVLSVQDPNNNGNLYYKNAGTFTLNGFVNIEGTMTIKGTVGPVLSDDVLNQPGYHNVKIWSWRECYDANCS